MVLSENTGPQSKQVLDRTMMRWWMFFLGGLGAASTRLRMYFALTFLGLGLFRDALFPGSERSKVNFKPSPVKKNRPSAQLTAANQRILVITCTSYFHIWAITYLKEKPKKFSSLRENAFPVSDYLKSFSLQPVHNMWRSVKLCLARPLVFFRSCQLNPHLVV